ncbi:hypothetical protein BDR26DRAFT_856635, partial [Obelidium mucronatum]
MAFKRSIKPSQRQKPKNLEMNLYYAFAFSALPLAVMSLPIPGGPQDAQVATTTATQILTAIIGNIPAIVGLITAVISGSATGNSSPVQLMSLAPTVTPLLTTDVYNSAIKVIQAGLDASQAATQAGSDPTKAIASVFGILSNTEVVQEASELIKVLTQVTGSLNAQASISIDANVIANGLAVFSNPQLIDNLAKLAQGAISAAATATTPNQAISSVLGACNEPASLKVLQDVYLALSATTDSKTAVAVGSGSPELEEV